jgi:hypothetical protein
VAALLAIYRDLGAFSRHQSEGVWRAKDTETLIAKRVVVDGAFANGRRGGRHAARE